MARAGGFSGQADIVGAAPGPIAEVAFPWWLVLLEGIAAVIIGLLLVTQPGATLLTLVVFLGVFWLIGGVLDLVGIFLDRRNWGWKLFTGILGIIAGLVIVRNPAWASIAVPTTLVWILATLGVVIGAANIVRAFTGGGWGTGLIGVLSIVLGIILFIRPLVAVTFLVYLAGFWAIFGGLMAIVGAFWLRGSRASAEMSRPAVN
jgi:uncharacterized membrane protein HdeD (DUF308 family)